VARNRVDFHGFVQENKRETILHTPVIDRTGKRFTMEVFACWGRTGFDLIDAPEAACRGLFVGLVKNRTKQNS
jgi:hypothetical protein